MASEINAEKNVSLQLKSRSNKKRKTTRVDFFNVKGSYQHKQQATDIYWNKFINNEEKNNSFSSLYKIYVNDLLSYGISLGVEEQTCRDAIHDIFYKLYIEKNKLKTVRNYSAYLFTSYRNHLLNIVNKHSKISDISVEDLPFTTEVTILDTIVSEEETAKLKKTVEQLLNELTPRQREAIYLRYMQQMEYDEVATLLNMNANSVRRLVSRAMDVMRDTASKSGIPVFVLILLLACYSRP